MTLTVYAIDDITPVVDPTAYVHPSAVLIGDVIIGPGVYIGPCASLRGDFGRGESVRVLGLDGAEIGRGLASYSAADLRRIAGRKTAEIETLLGYKYYDEAVRRDDFVLDRGTFAARSAGS